MLLELRVVPPERERSHFPHLVLSTAAGVVAAAVVGTSCLLVEVGGRLRGPSPSSLGESWSVGCLARVASRPTSLDFGEGEATFLERLQNMKYATVAVKNTADPQATSTPNNNPSESRFSKGNTTRRWTVELKKILTIQREIRLRTTKKAICANMESVRHCFSKRGKEKENKPPRTKTPPRRKIKRRPQTR
jgi:hypothetical protein